MKKTYRILITASILSLSLCCGGLIAVKVNPEETKNTQQNWITLGRNNQRQHFATTNIAPPLAVVWQRKTGSVIVDHPLAASDYIFAVTENGILNMIDYHTGESFGSGRISPGIERVPTLWEQKLFIGANLGKKTLHAFDLNKAEVVMSKSYPDISTSILVHDQKLYFGTEKNLFFCAAISDGNEIWNFKTRGEIFSSPALDSPRIIFADLKGWIYALDESSGIKLWETELSGSIYSHPVIDNSVIYIGTVEGLLFALNSRNGQIIWKQQFDGSVYGSPSIYENMVFVGNNAHQVLALNKETGEIIWEYQTKGIVNTTPLPSPDYLYVTSWDKKLHVLNRFSGKLIFVMEFENPLKTSPIIYRDYLLLQSANQDIYALANEKLVAERNQKK